MTTEAELDRLHQAAAPDPIGPRYNRRPDSGAVGGGGGGGTLRYLQVTAVKNASDAAWADFATDGYPSHYEGLETDSSGANDGSVTLVVLGCASPTTAKSGLIAEVGDVLAWKPLDGACDVPGDPGTPLDGLWVMTGLDAKFWPRVVD